MLAKNARLFILLVSAIDLVSWTSVVCAETADYVFQNGKVYTVDQKQPWAEAVAVKGNKISYVGSDSGSKQWIGPETTVIDLKGRMLMPGFIDGHNHYVAGAAGKRGVRLVGSKNTDELLARIRDYVKSNPDKSSYTGFGWEFPIFGDKEGTRQQLDAICSDKPMMFFNEDNHHVWFNTKAMNMAGFTKDSPDAVPGASYFKREKDGTPSGIAIEPDVWKEVAFKTEIMGGKEMLREIADEVFPMLPKIGITAYHDMGIWAPDYPQSYLGFELLLEMEKSGKLPVRFNGVYPIKDAKQPPEEHIATLKEWSKRYRSDLVGVTGLKIWADGTFLSHTAVEIEPYADEPDSRGESEWTTEVLTDWIDKAYAAGFDVNIHCEGDMSTRRCLDAVEAVSRKQPSSKQFSTLHHLPTIHPDDIPRFKALGVGADFTPVWLVDYKGQYQEALKILGKKKVAEEYGLANPLLKEGVNVTFGSDIPGTDVEEASPLFQTQAAVTGRVPGSTTAVVPPANRLPSLEQMLRGYTIAGARQMRMDDKIGSIETGKLADLIVLEKNLFDVPPEKLSDTKVQMTMMNGTITHRDGI